VVQPAAEAGDVTAQANLGLLLATMLDPPEIAQAGIWLTRAAEVGQVAGRPASGGCSLAASTLPTWLVHASGIPGPWKRETPTPKRGWRDWRVTDQCRQPGKEARRRIAAARKSCRPRKTYRFPKTFRRPRKTFPLPEGDLPPLEDFSAYITDKPSRSGSSPSRH
jgi:hypothetical protein